MKKNRLLKITIWSSSILLILAMVLVVHIYMVTHRPKNDPRVRQLSRIDFKQDIDSSEAEKIKSFIAGLEGVDGIFFNVSNDILVYSYTAGKQNSSDVYNKLMASGNYRAERYVVDEATAKGGCPAAIKNNSFTYHVSSYVSSLFKK